MRNLVVIVPDTLRQLETIPSLEPGTDCPTLSGLASASFGFRNAYATSPWTLPSHRSLLNGEDPWQARGPSQHPFGGRSPSSLADVWRESGGESIALSLNPLVSDRHGALKGYDLCAPAAANRAAEASWTASGGLDMVLGVLSRERLKRGKSPTDVRASGGLLGVGRGLLRGGVLATSRGLRLPFDSGILLRTLSRFLRSRKDRRPLHVFINLMDAHEPYIPSHESADSLWNTGAIPAFNLAIHSRALRAMPGASAGIRRMYAESLRRMDQCLGALLGLLRKHGVLDDATVCLASDHGQSLGENGFFGHGRFLYDEVIRIPAFVWQSRANAVPQQSAQIYEYVDHRHLHDALIGLIESPDRPLGTIVSAAVRSRGPAVSFVKAEPVTGVNPLAREPPYMRLRMCDQNGQVALQGVRANGGKALTWSWQYGGPQSDLGKSARAVVTSLEAKAESWNRMLDQDDVSARLMSWGYS